MKNIAVLTLGNTTGYAISILLLPLLTRCYAPDAFGRFALLWGLTQICGLAGTFRYEKALFLAQDEIEKRHIAQLAYFLSICFGVLLAVIVSALDAFSPLAIAIVGILPVTCFCQSVILIESADGNSRNQYARSGSARGLQAASASLLALALYKTDFAQDGLVYGLALSQIIVAGMLAASGSHPFLQLRRADLNALKPIFKRHLNFARYTTPHEIFGAASSQATALLIPAYFGTALAGIYFVAQKLVLLPSILIGTSTAQVYYHELTKRKSDRSACIQLFRTTLLTFSAASLTVFTLAYATAPTLVNWVLGPSWLEAGTYSRMLIPWAAIHLVGSVLSQTPQALGAQKTALFIELGNGTLRIAFLSVGFLTGSPLTGIVMFLASSILFSGSRIIWYSRLIRNHTP